MLKRTGARARHSNGKQFDVKLRSAPQQEVALIVNATKRHKRLKG
jgi:hypothetical protein